MTTTSLIGTWVLAGTALLFLLVFVGTGYRLYRKRRRLYYKRLPKINRILGWSRIGYMALGLAAAVRVAMRGPHYQTYLIAPCAWAVVVIIGVTLTDFFLFGRSRYSSLDKPKVRISVVLPWLLLLLLLLLLALERTATDWGQQTASIDQRSHVYSWVSNTVFGWGVRTPYPGTYYTTPLLYCVPAVLAVGLAAIILVLIRPAWLPAPKYAALDEGFRARTIRDIVLICVGAVSPALAMMGLDIAWAYATLGPGSTDRAIVVAIAFFVGAWNLGQTFWVFANLIFLPPVRENRRLADDIRVSTQRQPIHITGHLMPPPPRIEIVQPVEPAEPEIIEVEPAEPEGGPEAVQPSEAGSTNEVSGNEAPEPESTESGNEPECAEPEGETEVGESQVEPEGGRTEIEVQGKTVQSEPEGDQTEVEGETEVESAEETKLAEVVVTEGEPTEQAESTETTPEQGQPEQPETPEPEPTVPEEPLVSTHVDAPVPHPAKPVVPTKTPQPTATHRPGFKPKKKKPRRH